MKSEKKEPQKHNVETTLNYFPNDGSTPAPTYVGYILYLADLTRSTLLTTPMKQARDLPSTI